MNNFKSLIICSTLLLYCCEVRNPIPTKTISKGNDELSSNSTDTKDEDTTLTTEELMHKKLNLLKRAIGGAIQAHYGEDTSIIEYTEYIDFYNWFSRDENKQKQQELADTFTTVYNLLKDRKTNIH